MPFRWGIFGTGEISAKFVAGLAAARDAEASVVVSRTLAKAQAFADGMGVARAIEGYAGAAAASGVDAIYVATPPSMHVEHALSCIDAGVPVLVEKPFGATAADALRIAEAARAKSVFAMEAMWTRFVPAAQALKRKLAAGIAGEVRMVTGNFGSSQEPIAASGNFDPTRGGGAIAHLGPYPLSLAQWLFGTPTLVQALGTVGATGVDEDAAFQLRYPGGVIGSFFVSLRAWAPNEFHVMGSEGMTSFRGPILRPYGLDISQHPPLRLGEASFGWRARFRQHGLVHRLAQIADRSSRSGGTRLRQHYAGNGYHYEADEVRACIERGDGESTIMPLDDSTAVARTADTIRAAVRESANSGSYPA